MIEHKKEKAMKVVTEITRFRDHLIGKHLIRTPSDIFTLPEEAVLQAGLLGGLKAYKCRYNSIEVAVNLDKQLEMPTEGKLIIVYRGTPTAIEYFSRTEEKERSVFDPKVEVTVLGLLNEGGRRQEGANWAFIDSIYK